MAVDECFLNLVIDGPEKACEGLFDGVKGSNEPNDGDIGVYPAPWGAGASQETHDQAEIVTADVDQVALLDVVAAA